MDKRIPLAVLVAAFLSCSALPAQAGFDIGGTAASAAANDSGTTSPASLDNPGADGPVSRHEFLAAHKDDPQASAEFRRLDTNHDGYLSRAELEAATTPAAGSTR